MSKVELGGCGVVWTQQDVRVLMEYSGVQCKVKKEEGSERRCCTVLSAECELAERGTRFVFVHFQILHSAFDQLQQSIRNDVLPLEKEHQRWKNTAL